MIQRQSTTLLTKLCVEYFRQRTNICCSVKSANNNEITVEYLLVTPESPTSQSTLSGKEQQQHTIVCSISPYNVFSGTPPASAPPTGRLPRKSSCRFLKIFIYFFIFLNKKTQHIFFLWKKQANSNLRDVERGEC